MRGSRLSAQVAGAMLAFMALSAAAFAGGVGSRGGIIFRDDFSKPSSGWPVVQDRDTRAEYRDGAYLVKAKQPRLSAEIGNELERTVDAMSVEIDVTQRLSRHGDMAGVACYSDVGEGVGYFFIVSPGDRVAAIAKIDSRSAKNLVWRLMANAVQLRPNNHLRAECTGARPGKAAILNFFVNGKRVVQARNRSGFTRFRGIGVYVYSVEGGLDVSFDKALARQL